MRKDCDREDVGRLLDGEGTGAQRSDVMAHIDGCAECAAHYRGLQGLRLRLQVGRVPMPASLTHRVRTRIALEAAAPDRLRSAPPIVPASPPSRVVLRAQPWLRQAAAILLACGLSVAGALSWSHTSSERELIARDVVAAHVRSLLQGNSVQVASLDTHTVKPWFAGRLDYTPVVRDLAAQGFRLAGGRLDYVGGRRVAVLVYMRQLHQVSVFVWPSDGEETPRAAAPNGFNLVAWSHGGMTFWAISDLAESEIAELPPLL
jgi:anti-sigma factor RsiW